MNSNQKMGILLLALLAGCVTPQPPAEQGPTQPDSLFNEWGIAHNVSEEKAAQLLKEYYGIQDENQIFSQLPPTPPDFEKMKEKWRQGDANALENTPYEYYIQPAFYPNYDQWKKIWAAHPLEQTFTVGFSSTPAEQHARLENNSTTFDTTLFIGSAWGVNQYQGLALRASIEPQAPITIDFEPKTMILGPTFPIIDPHWIQKIHIHGNIQGKMEPGTYTIRVYPGNADPATLAKWGALDQNITLGENTLIDTRGLATLTLVVP